MCPFSWLFFLLQYYAFSFLSVFLFIEYNYILQVGCLPPGQKVHTWAWGVISFLSWGAVSVFSRWPPPPHPHPSPAPILVRMMSAIIISGCELTTRPIGIPIFSLADKAGQRHDGWHRDKRPVDARPPKGRSWSLPHLADALMNPG